MDRRQKKTRGAIFSALGILLEKKSYSSITVQEIIDTADIGRSTFYAHFETKDELLRAMCTDIFQHVTATLAVQHQDLEHALAHLFWHLRETRPSLKGILSSESASVFLRFFREYLTDFFQDYLSEPAAGVPASYVQNQAVTGFAETVRWWLTEHVEYSPEEMARFYLQTFPVETFRK